ncbi:hypothetical protein DJ549_21710 [Klebsiella grimontii]|nr:hypothetical protein DJ549_21710 [Klebsiella grimontii]
MYILLSKIFFTGPFFAADIAAKMGAEKSSAELKEVLNISGVNSPYSCLMSGRNHADHLSSSELQVEMMQDTRFETNERRLGNPLNTVNSPPFKSGDEVLLDGIRYMPGVKISSMLSVALISDFIINAP